MSSAGTISNHSGRGSTGADKRRLAIGQLGPASDERVSAVAVDGAPLRGVCNENEVRAAAGLTMAIGAVAFSYAYFTKQYVPLQAVASLFFLEFLVRVTAGIRYSPIGVVARAMTFDQPPEWVSAKPKRFAWTLGLAMTFAMTIITNVGIRGLLPRTICLICLTVMWTESALGLCLGCKIHGLIARRAWATSLRIEVCADGTCEPPRRESARSGRAEPTTGKGAR